MGKRIYFEDAASIALLYNYKVTKRNMLSFNRVKEFFGNILKSKYKDFADDLIENNILTKDDDIEL